MLIPLLAGLALVTPTINSATPYDPDDPDVVLIELSLATPDFLSLCALAYEGVDLLEIALGPDAASYAPDLYVSWVVEVFEDGLGRNLSESGEARMEEALYDCVDYGVAL